MEEDRNRSYGKRNCGNDINVGICGVGSMVRVVKCIYIRYREEEGMRKMKTKLKIDEAYFYAPYIPLFVDNEKELRRLWEQIVKNARCNEIFEEVED